MELATQQHGVVATRQLKPLGYSRSSVSKAAAAGRLRRLHRGVYAVGHEDLRWEGRCMAAVLACAPAVASHFTAAWLWGLLRSRPGTFHLTAATARRQRRGFVLHCTQLDPADLTERDGIPATALARTYLDLAALAPRRVERFLERGEELQLFDLREIDAAVRRAAGHPGRGPLRRALSIYRDDPVVLRSRTEERFRALLRRAGLSVPAANVNVGGFELDTYWERERFAVELDAFATHGTRAAFERDRLREDDLQLAGIEAIRITDRRLTQEPEAVMRRVASHLARRRRELGPPARAAAGRPPTRGG